ncbi:MAG: iron ABC transporter permease [Lachnospiraceae bacterium]|nr:iron ABC transporter permease [Lachnospiraceae bacterium]
MKRKPDFKNGVFHGKPVYVLAIILLIGVLILSILTAVTIGSVDLSVTDVYRVILYKIFGVGDPEIYGTGAMSDIVWFIRLPRILLATGVGMGLAVAGVVMQAIVKNPLADPYVLGISSGASLGATVAIFFGVNALLGSNAIGICAFIGAFCISLLVQMTANIGGRANSIRLLLAGTALSSVCSAFSNFIVFIAGEKNGIQTVTFWLMGSMAGAKWENIVVILPCVFLATLFFCSQYRILNMMLLGDEVSITLGTDLHRYRQLYLVVSSIVIGFVVYSAGIIGFVGLIIPHVVRMFFGTDHKRLLPISALSGSIFLIWADVACRVIIPKTEVPIGILVSMIGAPCFIYLLVKRSYGFGGERS